MLAFGYNANLDGSFDDKIPRPALRGVGAGTNAPDRPQFQPGPTIAGIIDMRDPRAPVTDGLVIEEGVLPGGFAMAFTAMFFVNEATSGDAFRFGDTALRLKDAAAIGAAITDNPAALGQFAYDGPVGRSQTYLVMSHDSSDGTLAFANDTTVVRWPGVGREASIARDNALLAQASDAIWAEFAPNPLWQDAMGRKLVSVHPIGGCVMADSVDRGVVNAWCQRNGGGKAGDRPGLADRLYQHPPPARGCACRRYSCRKTGGRADQSRVAATGHRPNGKGQRPDRRGRP